MLSVEVAIVSRVVLVGVGVDFEIASGICLFVYWFSINEVLRMRVWSKCGLPSVHEGVLLDV